VAHHGFPAKHPQPLWAAIAAFGLACLGEGTGCVSKTEFPHEGPGHLSDRASGQVPEGSISVCKLPVSKRPPIVDEKLWEDARPCTAKTSPRAIRLGYGAGIAGAETDAEADNNVERMLAALRDSRKDEGGNNPLALAIRNLREASLRDPLLRDRVARDAGRSGACDYAYLLGSMARERSKLAHGARCAVEAYDPKTHAEACLFDTNREEAVWLSGSFPCVARTLALGEESSCFRLCGYDDYCAKQVSCAAPDIDLVLCLLGVCVPDASGSAR
jgi:hypothetical protein